MTDVMTSGNHGGEHKPTVFLILDGYGLAPKDQDGNAIRPDTAPNMFSYLNTYPHTTLSTTGKDVGLFPGQKGNSEAGHLTIGAGRVVKQDLVLISDAIKDGTFFKNEAFKQALFHAKKYGTKLHVFSLLTDGNSAHAYPEHLYAVLDLARQEGIKEVCIHLFTDGRDSPPHAASTYLQLLREHLSEGQEVVSIMGRFWGMDRAKHWERTEAAYHTIVCGEATYHAHSAEEAISQAYNRNETDEYISPTVIQGEDEKPLGTVNDNDVIIFVNARSDRARQLTKAFVQEEFQAHNPGAFERRHRPQNIRFVAMTDFGPDLPGILTAFPSPDVDNALAKAIGESYKQLFISEMEKYAHVTYFLNGGYAKPINGEDREIIASNGVKNYQDKPEMNSREMTQKIISYLQAGTYDFICANYPNADMVGHTGNFAAAEKAIACIDEEISQIADAVLALDGQLIITADHGNAEQMKNLETNEIMTEHTTNPVPFVVIRHNFDASLRAGGTLADVAPTLLELLGLPVPDAMTGKSLIE